MSLSNYVVTLSGDNFESASCTGVHVSVCIMLGTPQSLGTTVTLSSRFPELLTALIPV